MDLLETVNTCEAVIKRKRSYAIEKLANVLDDEQEFNLTLGRLETLKKYRQRVLEIRRQYHDLIEEVEEIAEQANKI